MFPCTVSLPSTIGFGQHVLNNAMELWKSRILCDVELVANDGGVVPVHLEVVGAYLPGKINFDVSKSQLVVLVSLMYGAKVSLNNLVDALDLLQACLSTGFTSLAKELLALLRKHVESEDNLPFSLWSFARSHALPELEQLNSACLRAAALQFNTLWRQSRDEIVALPTPDLLKLLSDPFLVVAAEEQVCDLIAAKCSEASPEECLALARCFHPDLVTRSPTFGTDAPRTLSLAEYIVRAERMVRSIIGRGPPKSPRLPLDLLFCVGSSNNSLQVASFNMRRNSWQKVATRKNFLNRKLICHVLEHPYRKTQIVFLTQNYELSSMEVYSLDIGSGHLRELSTLDLPGRTPDHYLVHLKDDNLAIFSFFSFGDTSVEIRRYDATRNEWTLVKSLVGAELPHLEMPCLSRVKDELYLTGGYNTDQEEYSSHVYFFNEDLLSFTSIGFMTAMRHEVCEFGGKLVACGGFPVITVQTLEVTPRYCTLIGSVESVRRSSVSKMSKCDNAIVVYDLYGPTFKVMEPSGATFSRLPRLPFFGTAKGLVSVPTRNLNEWLVSESKMRERETETSPDFCTLTFCYNSALIFMRLFNSQDYIN